MSPNVVRDGGSREHSAVPPGYGGGRVGTAHAWRPYDDAKQVTSTAPSPHYDDAKQVTIATVDARNLRCRQARQVSQPEFQFINPHAFVYLRVVGADGTATVWHCELASRSVLARSTASTLRERHARRHDDELRSQSVKHVKITGSQARQNPTGCALREAFFDDGSVLRSSTLFGATPATSAVSAERSTSIVEYRDNGVWAMKTFRVSRYAGALTDEGERRRAAFDPIKDDPAIYCDPASPVRYARIMERHRPSGSPSTSLSRFAAKRIR